MKSKRLLRCAGRKRQQRAARRGCSGTCAPAAATCAGCRARRDHSSPRTPHPAAGPMQCAARQPASRQSGAGPPSSKWDDTTRGKRLRPGEFLSKHFATLCGWDCHPALRLSSCWLLGAAIRIWGGQSRRRTARRTWRWQQRVRRASTAPPALRCPTRRRTLQRPALPCPST